MAAGTFHRNVNSGNRHHDCKRNREREEVVAMAMATFKCEFPRRQAMLSIVEPHYKGNGIIKCDEIARVPVFVWPMPTSEGLFVVEHQDGTVQRVQPDSLTFLGSKELFDQYDWSERCAHTASQMTS